MNPCESNANYTCCILLHRTESRCLCEASPKILREFHLQPHWAPEGPNQWPAAVGHPGMACQDKFGWMHWMPSTCGLTMDYNAQLCTTASKIKPPSKLQLKTQLASTNSSKLLSGGDVTEIRSACAWPTGRAVTCCN